MTNLKDLFTRLNINYNEVGFYDSKEFLQVEKHDSYFLEKYAEHVQTKDYDYEYLIKAEQEIPLISEILNEELIKDGRLGACVDTSIVLSRILEKERYWNYIVKGSLTIIFPADCKVRTKYFWTLDSGDYIAAHSWVVAPPFSIIDLTVRQQNYKSGEENHLPKLICSKDKLIPIISEIDLISPDTIKLMELSGIKKNKLDYVKSDFNDYIKIFSPTSVLHNGVKFNYINTAIGAPDEPLERVSTLKLSGKLGIEIYNDIIIPKLKELRKTK